VGVDVAQTTTPELLSEHCGLCEHSCRRVTALHQITLQLYRPQSQSGPSDPMFPQVQVCRAPS
jgi:hypothetical protein